MVFDLVVLSGSVLRGAGAGVTYGVSGYLKNREQQPLDFGALAVAGLVGAAAGIIMGLLDLELDSSYEYLIALGAVPVAQNVVKALKRRFFV